MLSTLIGHSGVFVEAGPPDQVIESPRDPRTQRFLKRLLDKV